MSKSGRPRAPRGTHHGGEFVAGQRDAIPDLEMESRGWWELDIAGIDPNESTLGHIASLTRNGTTSGEIVQGDSRAEKETQSRGWWELEVTDVDLDDAALEHIADMISGGITSGEIV